MLKLILQLHEFWTIDEDEEDTQTLVDYMEEQGLNFPDEPHGWLGQLPSVRPGALGPPAYGPALQRAFQRHKQLLQPPPVPQETPAPKVEAPAAEEPEEDMFYEAPRKPAAVQSEPKPKLPVMRSLNVGEAKVSNEPLDSEPELTVSPSFTSPIRVSAQSTMPKSPPYLRSLWRDRIQEPRVSEAGSRPSGRDKTHGLFVTLPTECPTSCRQVLKR